MTESKPEPTEESPSTAEVSPSTAENRPTFSMEKHMNPQRVPSWVAPAALILGVVATVLSLWAIKTSSDNARVELAGDAKERVCTAFGRVAKAVRLQTNGGPEPLPEQLAATNSRQALLAGGEYLLAQIDGKTPKDLADAVTAFADDIQVLGINYLGGAVSTDPGQAERLKRADTGMTGIADMCSDAREAA